jgi:OPT family oligopeptide transporter
MGVITAVSYRDIVRWTLWGGGAVLLSSGLLSFAFQWRSVARSFRGLGAIFRRRRSEAGADPLAAVECPDWWFPAGFLLLSPVIVFLMHRLFGIPVWAGAVAIPLAFVMGIVASRVTGETDTTPTKALGPVTQLVYGGLLPGNIPANVMGANVTGGVGLHAADLLTDLKSGYLLGANPRQQAVGQLFGVLAGAVMVVPAFNLLVPSADVLGTEALPAPGAIVWAGVSKLLAMGSEALHPTARIAALVGALVGVVLVLAERWVPGRAKAFVPSAAGFGLAFVIPGNNAIAMFVGALIAELLRWRRPALAERGVVAVSSGLIAGESLIGILLAVLAATGLAR